MKKVLYYIGRAYCFLTKRLSDCFWRHYLVSYCCARKEITVANPKSLTFSGKTLLAVAPGSEVFFGKDVVINSSFHTISPSLTKIEVGGGKLTIGDHSGISSSVIICKDSITIGNYVNIGAGCLILDSNMHSSDWRVRSDRNEDNPDKAIKAPVIIGDYAFIGARCIINKGVSIGAKTMIAAGSVVVKDIPANCVAGGNPCKVIRVLENA